jgi:hypothetical protein
MREQLEKEIRRIVREELEIERSDQIPGVATCDKLSQKEAIWEDRQNLLAEVEHQVTACQLQVRGIERGSLGDDTETKQQIELWDARARALQSIGAFIRTHPIKVGS